MKTPWSLFIAALLASSSLMTTNAHAQQRSYRTLYAIYGISSPSPVGQVHRVNVSVVPGGSFDFCKRQIYAFQNKMAKTATQGVKTLKPACTETLPAQLSGPLNDDPSSKAYVTKVIGKGVQFFSVWYGLPAQKERQQAICNQLIKPLRSEGRDAVVTCTPPRAS